MTTGVPLPEHSAFEQHLIDTIEVLREALHIVRQYPDFDAGGPIPQMIDDVLAGRKSAMLESLAIIRESTILPEAPGEELP